MTKCSIAAFLNVLQPGKLKNCPLLWDGKINQSELSKAADIIDQAIVAHHSYPYPSCTPWLSGVRREAET